MTRQQSDEAAKNMQKIMESKRKAPPQDMDAGERLFWGTATAGMLLIALAMAFSCRASCAPLRHDIKAEERQ